MATILRVDTPKELRRLDAYLDKPSVRGRIAVSVIMALASPIVLIFSVLALNPIGVMVSLGWFALWTGWIWRIWHKLKPARPYRVQVRVGVREIREAHNRYRRLVGESSARDYALPLINAMYRISMSPVQGPAGEQRLVALMRERVQALGRLLDAEDKINHAADGLSLGDRVDLATVAAYQDSLNEVVTLLQSDA